MASRHLLSDECTLQAVQSFSLGQAGAPALQWSRCWLYDEVELLALLAFSLGRAGRPRSQGTLRRRSRLCKQSNPFRLGRRGRLRSRCEASGLSQGELKRDRLRAHPSALPLWLSVRSLWPLCSAFGLVAAIAATKTPHVGEARAPRLHTWLRSCCESCEGFAIHLNASRSAASKALESPQPSSRRPGCASRSKCESPHYCWYPPSPEIKRNSGGDPAPPELGLIFKPQRGG
jgi:hypothetical protein